MHFSCIGEAGEVSSDEKMMSGKTIMELYIDRKSNNVRSLFSQVRGSFYRLGAKLCYVEGDETNLRLMIGDKLIPGNGEQTEFPATKFFSRLCKNTGISENTLRAHVS